MKRVHTVRTSNTDLSVSLPFPGQEAVVYHGMATMAVEKVTLSNNVLLAGKMEACVCVLSYALQTVVETDRSPHTRNPVSKSEFRNAR